VGVTWPNSEPVKHKNKNPRICPDYHSGQSGMELEQSAVL
jgi:hypothetical protein